MTRVNPLVHGLAATAGLAFAYLISLSGHSTTGLQFVAPLLVILSVHGLWLLITRQTQAGVSLVLYRRAAQTSAGLLLGVFGVGLIAPPPAHADAGNFLAAAFGVVICVAVIAVVVGIFAALIWFVFKLVKLALGGGKSGPDSRLFDVGSLLATFLVLGVSSLEGVPGGYSFPGAQTSRASQVVDAPPEIVWQALQTATSPEFPLPAVLRLFPHPVAVEVDEGIALGSMRRVAFAGREGAGHLTLQVTERDAEKVVFEVQSDTSPIAEWVTHRKLIYHVAPAPGGARLTVELMHDRRLAPAWFFGPMVKGSVKLAMDVLARDVKARAESASGQSR